MIARPLRVAILDDDASVRTAVSRLLKTSGMFADTFATSADLLSGIEESCPDCILMDFYLPTLGGVEMLDYLRDIGVPAPVIMMTGQDDPALRDSCIMAGATAYLRKPFDADELLDTITRTARSAFDVN